MKKLDYLLIAAILLIAAVGMYVHSYWGGVLTGLALSCSVFITVGKIVFRKAQERIDKAIRDAFDDSED